MSVEVFQPESVFRPGAYAQAVRIGDVLFLAGQTPRNLDGSTAAPGDVRGQAEKVFENSTVVIASLMNPEWMVEVEAIAGLKSGT